MPKELNNSQNVTPMEELYLEMEPTPLANAALGIDMDVFYRTYSHYIV